MPGYGFALSIRIGGQINISGLRNRPGDRIDMLLVLFDQCVAHAEIVARINGAFFGFQIAYMTVGRDDLETTAKILLESFRL